MSIPCTTCDLLKRRDADAAPLWDSIYRTEGFDIVHAFGVSLPGWMVLVARRHIAAMDELTVREASELGTLLRRVSIGLKEIIGCEKTYVMQFAEGDGHHHVHLHLVPRASDMPIENRGPNIFNYMQPENEVPESTRNEIGAAMRRFLEKEFS